MTLQAGYFSRRAGGVNDPGKLDRYVNLVAPLTTVQDTFGQLIKGWASFASAWASKHPGANRRFYAGEAKHAESLITYRVRHRADLTNFMRLVDGDDTFEIIGMDEMGRAHFLDLTCRAVDQTIGAVGSYAPFAGFTDYVNNTGNTEIPQINNAVMFARVTFTGVASTRVIILDAPAAVGVSIQLSLVFPAVAGIVAEVRNLTAGGTLLYSVTSDGSQASASLQLVWNGGAWVPLQAVYPA